MQQYSGGYTNVRYQPCRLIAVLIMGKRLGPAGITSVYGVKCFMHSSIYSFTYLFSQHLQHLC